MQQWIKKGLFLLIAAQQLSSCQKNDREPRPDISQIQVSVDIQRFEKAFFNLDTANIALELAGLENEYREFAAVFLTQVVPANNPRLVPEGPQAFVKGFITHPEIRQLYDTCMVLYDDFSALEKEFEEAFRYLKYYFPELPTPDLTTYISGYSVGNFIYKDQSLAIGLDFFLGSNYPYQKYNPQNPNFSSYLTHSFNREHLVLKTLIPLVSDLAGPPPGERLLDHLIHTGKQLYVLDKLLPDTPDSILMEITSAQTTWLTDNERDIWAFFLSEDFLYSSNWQKIRKYVEYSPNSPGMPAEAPGRTATWLGWQMIRSYMKYMPETTLTQLLAEKDSQKIMQVSRYKPPRK